MREVFEFRNYKEFLKEVLKLKGRGSQGRMAQAIGVQSGFLSQVLGGDAHLSLEQGESLNRVLGHGSLESRFFLLLISLARAGSMELKKRFEDEVQNLLRHRLDLKTRFDIKKVLDTEAQSIYYSAWYYAAIHVAVSIPKLRKEEAIAEHFSLSLQRVREVLQWLASVGLVVKKSDGYRQGVTRLFLGNDSPWIHRHHANWRSQSMMSMDNHHENENTHFSAVVSLSHEDFVKIQEMLVKSVDAARSKIRESPEELVACLNLDFFKVGKS